MKCFGKILLLALFMPGFASADGQPDFSPPPVPEFMLHKPVKPLTLEEMKQQADEASKKAQAEKAAEEAKKQEKK